MPPHRIIGGLSRDVFMEHSEILEQIKRYNEWLDSPTSPPVKTNRDALDCINKNGFIHKDNLPDKDRIAMMMAFEFFNLINQGRISPDAQSPHGCSWHNYYKKFALSALDRAGGNYKK